MPLSSKFKADYVEFINDQLDKIPIESIEEFNVVIQSLQNIISPISGFKVNEKYKDRMFIIKDYLNSPEDYVESEDDFDEYQQIIKDRIEKKTTELQTLNNSQRNAYIQNYQAGRNVATINQQIMAERLPPDPNSDAHVLSEEEWLAEMEDDFDSEFDYDDSDSDLDSLSDDPDGFDPEQLRYTTKPGCVAAIEAGIFNIPWLAERTARQLEFITQPPCIAAMQGDDPIFTMESLADIDGEKLRYITNPGCIAAIEAGIFNASWLAERTPRQLQFITQPACIAAMQGEQPIFTMENLSGFDFEQLSHITKPECIAAIQEGIVTLEQLAEMEITELEDAIQTDDYPRQWNSIRGKS